MKRIWDPGGGCIERNLRGGAHLLAPAGPSPRTARPHMVVQSLLVGVCGGSWGLQKDFFFFDVLLDERRVISLGRSILTLLCHTVFSI